MSEAQCRACRLAQDQGGLWLLAGCTGVLGGLHQSLADATQGPQLRAVSLCSNTPALPLWAQPCYPSFCTPQLSHPTKSLAVTSRAEQEGEQKWGQQGTPLLATHCARESELLSTEALPLLHSRIALLISPPPCCCPHLAAFCR